MLFETTLSGAGRSSGQHVNALRRQLGLDGGGAGGATASPKKVKAAGSKKSDDGASNEAPVAGLEQLRKALREVMGENEEQGQAKVLQHQIPAVEQGAALSVGQIRGKREKERPSSMFKALSRDEKAKHDVGVKSCAPPLGTYRPKSGQSRPRMLGQADFAKPPGRSPLPSYGGELNDPPRRPERHIPAPHFAKSTPRKAQKLTCTVNSFTAGVLDGHLYCSTSSRSPQWDFSKSVDPQAKVRSTYFQPGQYRIPGPLSRTCVQFDKQIPRPPVADGVSATNHLPDRSLSRSCPVLSQSRAVVVPDLSKYRARDAFFKPANDNQSNAATFDAMEANRTLWRKPTNVDDFDKTLDRGTSIKGTRFYAQDVALQLARDNEMRGRPMSVELLAETPTTPKRVSNVDFDVMAGRTPERQWQDPSARTRDQSRNMKFERGTRPGETRAETGELSPLAGAISSSRRSRTFEALDEAIEAER